MRSLASGRPIMIRCRASGKGIREIDLGRDVGLSGPRAGRNQGRNGGGQKDKRRRSECDARLHGVARDDRTRKYTGGNASTYMHLNMRNESQQGQPFRLGLHAKAQSAKRRRKQQDRMSRAFLSFLGGFAPLREKFL